MTYREPLLFIRRLVVLYKGQPVFDQTFHDGLNIIRGRNSTGKSTIIDFAFFALGGDFVGWKPEAERCDNVIAELEVNLNRITVRRRVQKLKMQPMEIFFGDYDTAMDAGITDWQVYPFRRSETKESFSQILFRLLGFPEVRNEADSNITIHQLLRLICVDQLSSVLALFRDEQFDSPLTRKTVGELLYGIYDDRLYIDELRLRVVRRNLERSVAEHASLRAALSDSEQPLDLSQIVEARVDVEQRLNFVRDAIKGSADYYEIENAPEQLAELQGARENLREMKTRFGALSQEHSELELEIEDSREFLKNLSNRLKALDESLAAEEHLGKLALRVCPECLQPLDQHTAPGYCVLCKTPLGETGRRNRVAKMRHELVAQIQESSRLLEENESRLAERSRAFHEIQETLAAAQRRFEDLTDRTRSKRDAALDDLFVQRGVLEGRLETLDQQRKLAERVRELEERINSYRHEIVDLEQRISKAGLRQSERRITAEQTVNKYAVQLLRADLPLEDTFRVARDVKVDFERNISSVDNRISFSASSITYLKAAVHFAIFFASLELPFFRYPKLILNDNIEDKGMEEERSQNFQNLIAQLSANAKVRHQIIITTSMISPGLDNTDVCVGPFYTPEKKTLRLPPA